MGSNNNKIHGIVFILKTSTLFRCIFFHEVIMYYVHRSGFTIRGRVVAGGILGKMVKNCKKITKSTFLVQNSG